MNNKKKIVSMTAVSLVLGSAMATANASSDIVVKMREPLGISNMDRQAEKAAIQGGDFGAWKTYIESSGNTRILEKVNIDNFTRYAEAFNLRETGDAEGANAIMEELGLKCFGADEQGRGRGGERGGMIGEEDRTALETAIKNSDYDAWATVMGKVDENRMEGVVTKEKFNIIVRAYKMKASGDVGGAETLLQNSDIPGLVLMGSGMPRGGDRGRGTNGASGMDREALMAAYENGDYDAWKTLMGERGGKILEYVNADNFAQFAEAKILQSQGEFEEAETIMDGLGLPFHGRGARSEKSMAERSAAE